MDRQLTLGAPTVVPVEQGVEAMPWLFGAAIKHVVRTAECVQLPVLEARPAVAGATGSAGGRRR